MGINVTDLNHHFASLHALKNIQLEVQSGELVALLGPSGCGKTTLLRLIAGLEQIQSGDIQLCGQSMAKVPPEQRGVGLMFQDYALFPHMTVTKNIEYGLNKTNGHRKAWVQQNLENLGLAELANRFPHTLSGGQQQRVALIRALANEPKIMLLDEPFSALDEHLRQQVREETLDILKASGASTVMVTHDPEEAMFLADRVVVMDGGHIVQNDRPIEIYQNPNNAFIAGLFGPTNAFEGHCLHGKVVTPLGTFESDHENQAVKVMIRAKDIQIHQQGDLQGRIRSIHPMGNETHIRVDLEQFDGVIHVRSQEYLGHKKGDMLSLSVSPNAPFIFAE